MDIDNFRKNLKITKAQKKQGGVVETRKAGRPPKPGMKQFSIRMPAEINNQLKEFCSKTGIGMSPFISKCVKLVLNDKNLRNDMLVSEFL